MMVIGANEDFPIVAIKCIFKLLSCKPYMVLLYVENF